tara:strand:+ start:244 stop:483 length:240 start_codon:yes stop_codon:yes gene_type:complete
MPTYQFRNKTTGVEWEKEMKMSELDDYKKENDCRIVVSAPQIISGHGEGRLKTTDAFNDKLKEIKKKAGKHSTIGDSIK